MEDAASSSSPAAAAAAAAPATVPGKIFVGGISSRTDDTALAAHFGRYGTVQRAVVVRHWSTDESRGFGFVTFAGDSADAAAISACDEREKDHHIICGKKVDVKRAVHKENHSAAPNINSSSNGNAPNSKKIFVGGLPTDITDDEFWAYFEKFGPITDAVVLKDKNSYRPRGFGFVTFETEESAIEVLKNQFHDMRPDKKVEVKKAVPKIEDNMRRENNSDNNNGVSNSNNNINNGGKYSSGIREFSPVEYTPDKPIHPTISYPVQFCDYTNPYPLYTPKGYGPMVYGPMGYGPMGYCPINYAGWNYTNPNIIGYGSQMNPGNMQNSGTYNNVVNLYFRDYTDYSRGGNSGVVLSTNEGGSRNINAVEAETKADAIETKTKAEVTDKACGNNEECSKSQ